MYESPRLQRFGTLQSMTLGGGVASLDGLTPANATDGCVSTSVSGNTTIGTCLIVGAS